jgi:hypothetical protein
VRHADVETLVAAYRADLLAAGMFAEHPVTSVARRFFTRVGVDGWTRLSLAEQCALPLKDRRVVGWLIVTGRVRPSPDYLVACRPYLGDVAAHHHQVFYERFRAMSAQLGFDRMVRAANPASPSSRRTTRSPRRGARCAAKNANTSATATSAGGLPTTPKKTFRSDAIASQVLLRARAATKTR